MTPWLSVVMPIHHGETFLGATLNSAAAERPDGVEFLIYDSGADDGAARNVAMAFADRLSIGWRDTPEIKSWTAKSNLAVAEARAPLVTILHQDDVWLPGHLAAIRRGHAAFPDAVLSISPSLFIGPDGRRLGKWRLPFSTGLHCGADFAQILVVQNSVPLPGAVVKREAFVSCGGLDEALWYTPDWDLYLKLAEAGDVAVRSEATSAFRLHKGSQTMTGSRNLSDFRRQQETVLERHLLKVPKSSPGVERCARVSIEVNCALAAASAGDYTHLGGAMLKLVGLGPTGVARYVVQSRIVDRLTSRLRLFVAGKM